MGFEPDRVPEDGSAEGHLDDTPIYEVLLGIRDAAATGRLTVSAGHGENHMFFMKGRPVGVQLADSFHPLGQLLLELGRINASIFIQAQRMIAQGSRLPGQVFMQLGVLDEGSLKDVLAIQAHKKAEEFCRLGSRPFLYSRGLTFLTGFHSTPLDLYAVLYLAVRQQMGPASRRSFLDNLSTKQVRIDAERELLPAPLPVFKFGPPEERFLTRLRADWQTTQQLSETGTLPDDDVAVMLRFLHIVGWLKLRTAPGLEPEKPVVPPPRDRTSENGRAKAPEPEKPAPPRRRRSPERPKSDMHAAVAEAPTVKSRKKGSGKPSERPPERPSKKREEAAKRDETPPLPPPPGTRPPEGEGISSVIVSPDLVAPPRKKKRRKRRSEPLPSEGQSAESHTRKEKTNVGPLPSIIIDEE